MSTRQLFNNIARRRLVPPQPQKQYVKWYMNWADTAHKAVVLTCVVYYGIGVVYMFIQSRKNKGELRRKLIEAGVIDEDGRQLLHRLQDEDSWLGQKGVEKREALEQRIEQKHIAAKEAAQKAEEERLALEAANTDRTRIGIFDPDKSVIERNRRKKEEMEKVMDEKTMDPRVNVFYRKTGEEKSGLSSWFSWLNTKTGEQKQVEAEQGNASK